MKKKIPIYILWSIGKNAYYNQHKYNNVFQKYANYYAYLFGNSYLFTRENIRKMINLYLDFPIYYLQLEYFTWEEYRILFDVSNKDERYFYFRVLLFFYDSYNDINSLIRNDFYNRI